MCYFLGDTSFDISPVCTLCVETETINKLVMCVGAAFSFAIENVLLKFGSLVSRENLKPSILVLWQQSITTGQQWEGSVGSNHSHHGTFLQVYPWISSVLLGIYLEVCSRNLGRYLLQSFLRNYTRRGTQSPKFEAGVSKTSESFTLLVFSVHDLRQNKFSVLFDYHFII